MKKGFTILEVMGVIVLLGLLAYLVVPNILSNSAQDSLKTKATDVLKKGGEIKQAYDLFFMRTGSTPTKVTGTDAATGDGLVKGTTSTGGFLSMTPRFSGIGATAFTDTFDKTTYTGFGASGSADSVLLMSTTSQPFCDMYNHVANGVPLGTAFLGGADTDLITSCFGAASPYTIFYVVESK